MKIKSIKKIWQIDEVLVSTLTILSRILGLIRDCLLAYTLGSTWMSDAFFIAYKIPNLARRVLAEGALSSSIIPVISKELLINELRAKKLFFNIIVISLLILSPILFLSYFKTIDIISIIAPGTTNNQNTLELTSSLIINLLPYLLFLTLIAATGAILNIFKNFLIPSIGSSVVNIFMIISLLFFTSEPISATHILTKMISFAALLCLVINFYFLYKKGFLPSPNLELFSSSTYSYLRMFIPAAATASIYQLMIFISVVLSSLFGEGVISIFYYADRLLQFPLGVFTAAFTTVMLPRLSSHSAMKNSVQFQNQLTKSLLWISYITIPSSIGLFCLSNELVSSIYLRGNFSKHYAEITSDILGILALGLYPTSVVSVLSRSFLAKRNWKVPMFTSLSMLIMSCLISIIFMGKVPETGLTYLDGVINFASKISPLSLGLTALALSGPISSLIISIALIILLSMEGSINLKIIYKDFLSSVLASLSIFICTSMINYSNHYLNVAIAVPASMICYFVTSFLLKNSQAKEIYSYLFSSFKKLPTLN